MNNKYIAARLKQARLDAGMKLEDVAAIMHTTDSRISRVERGIIRLNADELEEFSRIYRKPITYFFSDNTIERELHDILREAQTKANQIADLGPHKIHVVAEGSAGTGIENDTEIDAGDFRYWVGPKEQVRYMRGIKVTGDCLVPDVNPGDVLICRKGIQAIDGDIVICLLDGHIAIKRYKERNGNKWLECNSGRIPDGNTCEIKAVALERNNHLRRTR